MRGTIVITEVTFKDDNKKEEDGEGEEGEKKVQDGEE